MRTVRHLVFYKLRRSNLEPGTVVRQSRSPIAGSGNEIGCEIERLSFSYPEPILRAVNGARQGALAKSISNWHLIGYNEGYCSNTGYILLPCFHGIRLWIWPEPLVAPRVRRAPGTRMALHHTRHSRTQSPPYARCDEGLWPNPKPETIKTW